MKTNIPCNGVSKITLATQGPNVNHRAIWANASVVSGEGKAVYLSNILKQQKKLPYNMTERLLSRVDPEPKTETLSEAMGKNLIERDWLMQAEGEDLGVRAIDEIKWARQLVLKQAYVVAKNCF
jgi:hypothetical protein